MVDKDQAAWQQRLQTLKQVDFWSFDGRVAVRDAEADGWNASLRWQQEGEHYDIRLAGVLGQGGARIHGNGGQAVMESADRAAQSAPSPEALMQDQLGWHVPVQGLKYWLTGRPSPDAVLNRELDHLGRLSSLVQDGWEIRYRRYGRVNGYELPLKLELNNHRLRVRLVIDRWRLHEKTDV